MIPAQHLAAHQWGTHPGSPINLAALVDTVAIIGQDMFEKLPPTQGPWRRGNHIPSTGRSRRRRRITSGVIVTLCVEQQGGDRDGSVQVLGGETLFADAQARVGGEHLVASRVPTRIGPEGDEGRPWRLNSAPIDQLVLELFEALGIGRRSPAQDVQFLARHVCGGRKHGISVWMFLPKPLSRWKHLASALPANLCSVPLSFEVAGALSITSHESTLNAPTTTGNTEEAPRAA